MQELLSTLPSVRLVEKVRRRFYARVLQGCGERVEISQHVILKFPEQLSLGDHVFINRGTFITARAPITIGNFVSIGPYSIINSGDHRYQDSEVAVRHQGHELRPIVIHDDVWIGAHACVLKGAVLGRGCVVAAGAVVTGEVEPYTVVAGVPARPIASRGTVSATG